MSNKDSDKNQELQPPQRQRGHGTESEMMPRPQAEKSEHVGCGKLEDKVAVITGGDSGIGKAVAIAFAKEGADIAIIYLSGDDDANDTKRAVEDEGRRCLLIKGDVGDERLCQKAVGQTVEELGGLDILVNNAAEQHPQDSIDKITSEQLERTFRTNIFGMFYMTKAALKHLKEGSTIINTTSVTAYKGSPQLLDYSATKGAIVAFTRSLSQSLSAMIFAFAILNGPRGATRQPTGPASRTPVLFLPSHAGRGCSP
jgi:NAD(P)-dependent dehydrogenase (short-subunit alcohol dehydrogenase family)